MFIFKTDKQKKQFGIVSGGTKKTALFLLCVWFVPLFAGEQQIVMVTCSWNNAEWAKRNLDSTTQQNYSNWHLIYVDDCSSDNTADLVRKYIFEYHLEDKVTVVRNETRRRQMAGLYYAVHSLDDDAIVAVVDGDDWLAHKDVLKKLNEVYSDENVWMTYGQFEFYPSGKKGIGKTFPENIIQGNAYRRYKWMSSHLRTFRAGLFKKIKREDLMYGGDFFYAGTDLAATYPMLEMSGGHFRFIPDVLYVYNYETGQNLKTLQTGLSDKMAGVIRGRQRYSPLNKRPW